MKINEWLNHHCVKAKEKKETYYGTDTEDITVRKHKRYKQTRNEYTIVRKEAQINFEKDIIEKSKDHPKLFYSYMKSKSKVKDKIQSITDKGKNYVNEEEICEVLNNDSQLVLSKATTNICRNHKIKTNCQKFGKKANIFPLYKKRNRQWPLNYRPVSFPSIVCKILEKLIRRDG